MSIMAKEGGESFSHLRPPLSTIMNFFEIYLIRKNLMFWNY